MKSLQQLNPSLYLGQTFVVNFKKVKVIASMEGNQKHSHALVQGGFAVMRKQPVFYGLKFTRHARF